MVVTPSDFQKISLKIGKITAATSIPGKTKILTVTVDLGDRVAQAIVGGAEYYEPTAFIGRLVVVLTNMAPKIVAGIKSEAMLLAADVNGKPVWLTVQEDVPAGTVVR